MTTGKPTTGKPTTGKAQWGRAIAADFLESPAAWFAAPYLGDAAAEPPGEGAGAAVGRYRLLREIGRGGMGCVWLAERADGQFEQQVALKLVKRGMDSDEILARFLRERQILARLVHPNIARLLDGGISDDGRPYFVMEHVVGTPITAYCDARRSGVAARLRLFAVTCRAVQHAHRGLVVHRDIKPSNVLVTDGGEVKLLDFGVAALLAEDGAEAVTAGGAAGGTRPMTPEYASPEQLAGEPATTAGDVYQLGILLHELLTGCRPCRRAGRGGPAEEDEPTRPSAAVGRARRLVRRDGSASTVEPDAVARARGTTPDDLRRALRGDLDAIVLHALRPEPERRYPSAEALAEDVERHLGHLPIRSADGGWGYRAAKFVRRHRARVAAAVLVAAASGVVGTAYVLRVRAERDRAEREAAKASEIAALLGHFFQGWSPDAADRGKVSAEGMLAGAVLRARRELAREPELLAATLSMLGDLHAALGRTATADSLLGEALASQERLVPIPAADLAATLARRGQLYILAGRFPEAEATLRRAAAAYRPIVPPTRAAVLRVQSDLAVALTMQERHAEAEALLRDVRRRLADDADAPFAMEVATRLGLVLFREARYAEATELLRPTLARQRRVLGPFYQASLWTMRALASSLRAQQALAEAERLDREALEITRTLYGETHVETYHGRMALAVLLEQKGDFAEAERVAREALRDAERLFGEANLNTALTLRTLGGVLLAAGREAEAEPVLRRALAAFARAAPNGNPDEGDVLNRLAYLAARRRAADAAALYGRAAALERGRAPDGPAFITGGYEYLGWAARRMRDPALAGRLYRRAVALYDRELPDGHPYRAEAHVGAGETLLEAGRAAEGTAELRAGLAQWEAARPPRPERVDEVRRRLEASRRP